METVYCYYLTIASVASRRAAQNTATENQKSSHDGGLRLELPEKECSAAFFDASILLRSPPKGYDYERLFSLIACPVLIIQGSPAQGGMLTNEEIEQALTLLPDAMVARMETVGHPLHTQEKELVLLAMTAFLNTL